MHDEISVLISHCPIVPSAPVESRGFLLVHTNGGLNQMRAGVGTLSLSSYLFVATPTVYFVYSPSILNTNLEFFP